MRNFSLERWKFNRTLTYIDSIEIEGICGSTIFKLPDDMRSHIWKSKNQFISYHGNLSFKLNDYEYI